MRTATVALIFVLSASSIAFAQSGAMKPADPPKAMDMHNCMDMKGMSGCCIVVSDGHALFCMC